MNLMTWILTPRCEDEREQALYYLQTLNTIDFSCFTNAYTKSSVLYQVRL